MARNRRGALRWARLAALWTLVGAGSTEAAGVVGNGTPGSCTEGALNAALAGGGTVTFNCGASPVVIPITSQKVIAAATTVDGGSPDRIILDAGGATRHFTTNQTVALTVRNLTLRNGRCPIPDPGQPSPGYGGSIRSGIASPLTVTDSRFINNVCDATGNDVGGGAIRQRLGALTIQRTLFQGNRAGNAGGISSSDSSVLIEDSTFLSNTTNAFVGGFSGVGGGFYNDGSGGGLVLIRRTLFQGNSATFRAGALQSFFYPPDQGLRLEDCTFIGNSSNNGPGALLHQVGPLTVLRSSFAGNTSSGDGGGAFLFQSSPTTIADTTFSDNQASSQGGGLWLVTSAPTQITNSTFSGNRLTGGSSVGGGIAANDSNGVTLTHVTVTGNQAAFGGGISTSSGSAVTLRASIVSGNTTAGGQPRNCSATFGNGGFNVQFPAATGGADAACTSGATMADPQLGPLANNGGPSATHALGGGSAARNLVTSGCPPPNTDQRGVARPQGGACDSGSFESNNVVSIAGTSVIEGTGGSSTASFTVSLASAASQTVTVGFSTANGTAVAGSDYTATSGTVTFPPGTTSRTASVPVTGDALDENDETFVVNLSNAVNASIGTGQATGTILDDDAPPTISVGDCVTAEGGTCVVPFSLGAASGKTVTVSYATASGSAQSGTDFVAASGTATILPGSTGTAAFVSTIDDAIDEQDETFGVNLSNPGNATIGDGQGVGGIDDNDGPTIAVTDLSIAEGDAGGTTATFTVNLSAASVQPVRVDFSTSDGTATSGQDYAAASGSLSFSVGATTRTANVTVNGDTVNEPHERFYLNLSNPIDGFVGDTGTGTILDDDGGAIALRELAHGMTLWDTLATGPDLFLIAVPPRTSYEVVVDGASGDVGAGNGPLLERLGNDLAVVQGSVAAGSGPARSLRWQNATSSAQAHYVRVSSAQCTSCGADDVYRLRVYETGGSLPRFNCGGGQVSVVVVQNRAESSRSGTLHFWSSAGMLLGSSAFTLNARGSTAISACGVGGVSGQSGTVTLRHDGRLGDVDAKTAALDPASGFSFDTPLSTRRR